MAVGLMPPRMLSTSQPQSTPLSAAVRTSVSTRGTLRIAQRLAQSLPSEYEWSSTVGTYSGFTAYPLWCAVAIRPLPCLTVLGTRTTMATLRSAILGPTRSVAGPRLRSSSTTTKALLASLLTSTGAYLCRHSALTWCRYPDSVIAMRNKTLSNPQPLVDLAKLRAEIAANKAQSK